MRRLINKLKRGLLYLGALAHRQETTDGLVLLLVFASAWWMTAQQGGARAEALPGATRLMLGALAVHGGSLLIRKDEGVRVSLLGLAGLPFVAWLAIDAVCIAPDRGVAIHGLTMVAVAATGWHLVLHHARRTWSHVMALVLLSAPASILACGAFDSDEHRISGLLDIPRNPAYAGHFTSAMGTPGACAAVMLLALMPALAMVINPALRTWKRVVAGYFAALLLLGFIATHHAWAWGAFALGVAAMAWALCRSNKLRLALMAVTGAAGWMLSMEAVWRVGILRAAPEDGAGTAWLARAAGAAFRSHPLVGDGADSFPLAFEGVRPAGWQTDPATCGSLPLQLLCEHGLVGSLVILIPACWLAWRCLRRGYARDGDSPAAVTAAGGRNRAALRRSLAVGAVTGATGAALVLCVDYPASLPGVLLLMAATLAVSFRLSQEEETRVIPARWIQALGIAGLAGAVIATPLVLSPLESAALAADASETVARFSPDGLNPPGLLRPDAQSELSMAADELDRACRLNPLDGSAHAWHAQSLALLVRQTPRDQALQGRARRVAEEAALLSPRSTWTRMVLGSILLGSNEAAERERGLAQIREAAGQAPMNQSVALRLALALGQAGAGASDLLAAYERAQLTNPSRAEVRDKITLLRSTGAGGKTER